MHIRNPLFLLWLIVATLYASPSIADEPSLSAGNLYVRASIISDKAVFQVSNNTAKDPYADPAPSARIAVRFVIEPGWHIYWQNSGEAAYPTKVKWESPEGWRIGELRWPAPQRFSELGAITTYGYENEVILIADLFSPPAEPLNDQSVDIGAEVKWLVCREKCVPGKSVLKSTFLFSSTAPATPSDFYSAISRFDSLTPKPTTFLNSLPELQSATFQSSVSTSHVLPGGSLSARFLFSAFPQITSADFAKNVQLFPLASDVLSFGNPSLIQMQHGHLQQGESVSDAGEFLVTMPVKVSPSTPAGERKFGGIAVLSKEITKTSEDVSVEWSSTFVVSTTQILAGKDAASLSGSELLPLTYRVVAHEKTAPEMPLVLHPESPSFWSGFLTALFSAFVAGIILNLMPCVLPIISIKALGFVQQKGQHRSDAMAAAFTYSAGVLFTFLVLALTIIGLRQAGIAVGWGFHFQQPVFVLIVIVVVFLLSLSFFDLYSLNLPGIQSANRLAGEITRPNTRHFFDGVLATALSTPCSAPVLGTALTFAFTQPPFVTIAVFLTIGLGLALPYVLLTTNPKLLSLLPRPGNWMNYLKQFMGFLLLGTAVWLLFVLSRLTEEGVVWGVALLLLIYFALWVNSCLKQAQVGRTKKLVADFVLILLIAGSIHLFWPELTRRRSSEVESYASALIDWKPFSMELLESAKAGKSTVFIDFTADWCITCKANEKLVIETPEVAEALRRYNVTAIKADWTSGEGVVDQALKEFGGQGVPLYVVIPASDQAASILPTILTKGILIDAFSKASTPKRTTSITAKLRN